MSTFNIRPYNTADLPALYQICLQTGDNGADATHLYDDPDILGHFYVAPYVAFEPELCFVLANPTRPIGYVLGTANVVNFGVYCEDNWFPPLRQRYPLPPANDRSPQAGLIRLIHQGHLPDSGLEMYPAELHIDILPAGQGQGQGQKLIELFVSALYRKNVSGLHLGVSKKNEGAMRFYERLGFKPLKDYDSALVFGVRLIP